MILYMTWFSERGRELAARIAELSLSVSYGFWQSRYGGHPAVSKIQIRERGNRSLPDFLEEAFAQLEQIINTMEQDELPLEDALERSGLPSEPWHL